MNDTVSSGALELEFTSIKEGKTRWRFFAAGHTNGSCVGNGKGHG
jgi:hypothetical protein